MSRVVASARGWIGTPYMHQASKKNVGCDCLGLIRGVWRDVYGDEPETVPTYTADWSEPQGNDVLWSSLQRHFCPCEGEVLQLGDLLLFRMRRNAVAKHLGIVSALGASSKFIHAYTRHGVVESPLSSPWVAKVVARFSF